MGTMRISPLCTETRGTVRGGRVRPDGSFWGGKEPGVGEELPRYGMKKRVKTETMAVKGNKEAGGLFPSLLCVRY